MGQIYLFVYLCIIKLTMTMLFEKDCFGIIPNHNIQLISLKSCQSPLKSMFLSISEGVIMPNIDSSTRRVYVFLPVHNHVIKLWTIVSYENKEPLNCLGSKIFRSFLMMACPQNFSKWHLPGKFPDRLTISILRGLTGSLKISWGTQETVYLERIEHRWTIIQITKL